MRDTDYSRNTPADAALHGRQADSNLSQHVFDHLYPSKAGKEGNLGTPNGQSRGGRSEHLPSIELFDSKPQTPMNYSPITTAKPIDNTEKKPADVIEHKPAAIKETPVNGVPVKGSPEEQPTRVYNGKNYTETSIDKKDGSKKIKTYDDATKTTDSVTRDINGNPQVLTHDDPNTASTRIYDGRDYIDISKDKKTGNSTTTRYNDKFRSFETVVSDKDGKVTKRSHDLDV
jgi:hypothetical protein